MRLSVDVHNFLQEKAVPHEIFLANQPSKTAKRAAALLGLKLSEITKSIIFYTGEEPIITIVSGDKKVSYKKLTRVLGTLDIRLATPEEVVDLTGYPVGATPPVAHLNKLRTFIDHEVMGKDLLYTGGGEINAMLKMKPEDLAWVTEAEIVDIAD